MNGADLLAEFRANQAEKAFSELVQRYANLVYSIAKRRVANVTLAEEVSQMVFIRLAKTPPKLESEGQLLGWLHRTTVHVSIDLWRSETRRRAREQHALAMQTDRTEEIAWNEMTPVLDEALDGLDESDRQIILLRFFEQKTMADLARTLDVSEDAAKMRVSRAVGRLRTRLGGLGATCSATLLGTLLYERSVEAAPVGHAATLAAIRIAAPAGLAGGLIGLLSGAAGSKIVPTLMAAIVIGVIALLLLHGTWRSHSPGTLSRTTNGQQESGQSNAALVANSETNDAGDPDPVKLLQGVARARKRIVSGIIEFDIVRFAKNLAPRDATNETHLKIQFEEGGRIWSDYSGQRFFSPGGPEEAQKRADAMPLAQAVREGLIQPFTQHDVSYCDGEIEVDYGESDNLYRTTVIKPGYSGASLYDPRCLGLSCSLKPFTTIETCLGYKDAKAVKLIGKEPVEGNAAWHIRFQNKYDYDFDFWIDALHPTRVLKMEDNGNVSLSRYSDSDLKDPLPTQIIDIDNVHSEGFRWDSVRRNTRYNVSIDPVCWTLDGLHMKVGTEVGDDRKHRLIGYWNGVGLSGLRPKEQPLQPPANRTELLALLDNEPASPAGFGAALWILTNSPDGADVQKAGDVITQSHAESPEMESLVRDLDRMRPGCSTNLLPAIVDRNPDINVRANACMVLATVLKDFGENGKSKPATDEAEKYYERVIAEFGQIPGENGTTLAELAELQLSELRRLSIGKVAPEIDGTDLYGNPMKLSDYRGKIVTLLFWDDIHNSENEAFHFNSLADQMEGKPFVLLGIHSGDQEKARTAAEKCGVKWLSFHDASEGAIRKAYNVGNEWRTIYVLDRKGVIRYRGLLYPQEVERAVDKLLKE